MRATRFFTLFARLSAALLFGAALLAAEPTRAQTDDLPRFEVGAHLGSIDMRESIGEKPLGVGGRFSYNFHEYAAFDAELNYFSTPEVTLERTQGLFGIKVGKRFGGDNPKVGVFFKVRPGYMRFLGAREPGSSVNGTTKFALDVGGVVEFYPSKRTVVRFDAGNTSIFYNGETDRIFSLPGAPQQRLGTHHGLQSSIGVGFRF